MSATISPETFAQLKTDSEALATLKAYIEALTSTSVTMNVGSSSISFSAGTYGNTLSVAISSGGINVQSQYYGRGDLAGIRDKIKAAAEQLALVSASNQIAALLYQKYLVESDIKVEGGARLITLTI